jgi:hypothetical protein
MDNQHRPADVDRSNADKTANELADDLNYQDYAVKCLLTGDFTVPINNFDGDTKNKWRLTAIVTSSGAKSATDVLGKPFGIKYWYAHRIEIEAEKDGELIPATRIVFILDDESIVAFVSDGIAKGLATLVQYNGIGPYSPAVMVEVKQGETRNRRRIYNLLPA